MRPSCSCGSCKCCRHREHQHAWRERNHAQSLAISRSYYARNKERWQGYLDPEKKRAQHLVFTEVRAGRMIRQGCEECGAQTEAHHDDYAKPLNVRWLCRLHHQRHHAQVAA